MLQDPRIAKELSEEIRILKSQYGPSWKQVRKQIIREAQKRAIEKAVKRMGKKAFIKFLASQAAGKIIPIYGQISIAWDACKAAYCTAIAWL